MSRELLLLVTFFQGVWAEGPHDHGTAPPVFVTDLEMAGVRNGVNRTDLKLWSSDNSIKFLFNGDKFMGRLHEILSGTERGDFVYMTCWEMNVDVLLKPLAGEPNKNASQASSLINVLAGAASRGVEVKILYTFGASSWGTAPAQCDRVNEACGNGTCILDARHGHYKTGSSHEKIWLVRRGLYLTAFTGSMDTSTARWDTSKHDIGDPRWKQQPLDPVRRCPWHGTMYEIVGSAAEDIMKTFVARWNDPVKSGVWIGSVLPHIKLWLQSDEPSFTGYQGNLTVQVVRTFACVATQGILTPSLYQHFAPHGEFSYAAAWFKALRLAKDYIFVADQFMWYDEALAAVVEAAEHVNFVIILTNKGLFDINIDYFNTSMPLGAWKDAVQYYQYRAVIAAALKRDPTGQLMKKIHMFSLAKEGTNATQAQDNIYNHEKTLLVDDEVALVGSTGVERAGFTNDAELSLLIHSKDFATELRKKDFGEFLMLDPSNKKLERPQDAFQEWMRQADIGVNRVRHFTPNGDLHLQQPMAAAMYEFVEPDGRCTDAAHKNQWPGPQCQLESNDVQIMI